MAEIQLALHGGAGSLSEELKIPEIREAYQQVLKVAFEAAFKQLRNGAGSEEAVLTAIMALEDSKLFNAGRGSVLNADSDVSMDAALMLGEKKEVGSVIGTSRTKNPIQLAQLILHESAHNTLYGKGADAFAKEQHLTIKPLSYFKTQEREEQLQIAKKHNQVILDHSSHPSPEKFGTVGAVALDKFGNLAAGTSTGGLANKIKGRVGDSPIIGAGTFADNQTCAISATGKGEEFIRHTVAAQIHFHLLHKKVRLASAVKKAVHETLEPDTGGLIAISQSGEVALDYNTDIMFRAYWDSKKGLQVKI